MRSPIRWLQDLVRRRRLEREAGEELRFHVEALVEEKLRAGATREQAQRQARWELGDVEPVLEQLSEARPGAAIEALGRDLLGSAVSLAHAPGFSLVCVLLIGLGVGASTALFTLVDRVLLHPLPFPASERLVRIFERSPERGVERTGVARGNLAAWHAEARLFEGMAVSYAMGRTLSDGESKVVLASQATCDFFPLLGVPVLHGGTFTERSASARPIAGRRRRSGPTLWLCSATGCGSAASAPTRRPLVAPS